MPHESAHFRDSAPTARRKIRALDQSRSRSDCQCRRMALHRLFRASRPRRGCARPLRFQAARLKHSGTVRIAERCRVTIVVRGARDRKRHWSSLTATSVAARGDPYESKTRGSALTRRRTTSRNPLPTGPRWVADGHQPRPRDVRADQPSFARPRRATSTLSLLRLAGS
jgi:hypothetical protein